MQYQTKARQVKAVQSNGDNFEEFMGVIGPGSQYLAFSYKNVGGPGRGMHKALFIESARQKWIVDKEEWLVVFEDSSMSVLKNDQFELYFEESNQ